MRRLVGDATAAIGPQGRQHVLVQPPGRDERHPIDPVIDALELAAPRERVQRPDGDPQFARVLARQEVEGLGCAFGKLLAANTGLIAIWWITMPSFTS
jgi:hypothetical protein